MTLDVSDLEWHIQSCTEMKYMQLSSDGKVIKNLGLPCEGLIELEARIVVYGLYQCTRKSIDE